MKKTSAILALLFVFIFVLTGCSEENSYEEKDLKATVLQCEKGSFHPNGSYQATANMYLVNGNTSMWSLYNSLAMSAGTYDYNITVNIEGKAVIVVRSEQYEVGDEIVIKEISTYNNSELIKTEYK